MINWFLYIIRCNNKSLYTGITTDVKRRFKEHQNGKGSKYLRGKSPLKLVFKKKIGKKGLALRLEVGIKKLTKKKKEMIVKRKIRINKTNIK